MRNPTRILSQILKLKNELEVQGERLPPGLAGMYGEILAYRKLKEIFGKRFSINFFSGQKGADVQLVNGTRRLNLEIKTSRLKEEGFGKWYGAALNVKKCKHHQHMHKHLTRGKIEGDFCYFDFVVFVALSKTFSTCRYYIIPRRFIDENEELLRNTHKRFSRSTHRIIISNGKKMPNMPPRQRGLIKKTEAFRNRWDLVRSEINLATSLR
jgi:hypothetical protein